jgi:hypothetical protein
VTSKVLLIAVLSFGTAVVSGQPQPRTFFKDYIHLADADIQKIGQGQIVTKVLESGDKNYGLLVFGAVYVNAPVASFPGVVRDIKKLVENKVYLAVQEFSRNGAPPKLSDFDRLELDRKDVDELEHCKAADCDIQIMTPSDLQNRVDWKSKDHYQQVNSLVREKIFQGMSIYMKDGLKPLGSYRDREKPLNLYEATVA